MYPLPPGLDMLVSTRQIGMALHRWWLRLCMKDSGHPEAVESSWLLLFCTLHLVFQFSLMAFLKHDLKL